MANYVSKRGVWDISVGEVEYIIESVSWYKTLSPSLFITPHNFSLAHAVQKAAMSTFVLPLIGRKSSEFWNSNSMIFSFIT